jgi:hypothetical protein
MQAAKTHDFQFTGRTRRVLGQYLKQVRVNALCASRFQTKESDQQVPTLEGQCNTTH